jgi:hypothetical protein
MSECPLLTQSGHQWRDELGDEPACRTRLLDENTFRTSGRARAMPMVSVWLVTTGFVIATFVITKVRGYKKMPRGLRDAITADAIFGALLVVRALL